WTGRALAPAKCLTFSASRRGQCRLPPLYTPGHAVNGGRSRAGIGSVTARSELEESGSSRTERDFWLIFTRCVSCASASPRATKVRNSETARAAPGNRSPGRLDLIDQKPSNVLDTDVTFVRSTDRRRGPRYQAIHR